MPEKKELPVAMDYEVYQPMRRLQKPNLENNGSAAQNEQLRKQSGQMSGRVRKGSQPISFTVSPQASDRRVSLATVNVNTDNDGSSSPYGGFTRGGITRQPSQYVRRCSVSEFAGTQQGKNCSATIRRRSRSHTIVDSPDLPKLEVFQQQAQSNMQNGFDETTNTLQVPSPSLPRRKRSNEEREEVVISQTTPIITDSSDGDMKRRRRSGVVTTTPSQGESSGKASSGKRRVSMPGLIPSLMSIPKRLSRAGIRKSSIDNTAPEMTLPPDLSDDQDEGAPPEDASIGITLQELAMLQKLADNRVKSDDDNDEMSDGETEAAADSYHRRPVSGRCSLQPVMASSPAVNTNMRTTRRKSAGNVSPRAARRGSVDQLNRLSPMVEEHGSQMSIDSKSTSSEAMTPDAEDQTTSPLRVFPALSATPNKLVPPSPNKRDTQWHETVKPDVYKNLSKAEFERQEAIFELYKGEEHLAEDLQKIITTYSRALRIFGKCTQEELETIFGHIEKLVPIHQQLAHSMLGLRLDDGITEDVGRVVLKWVTRLSEYISYISNQIYAKALLDRKKEKPEIRDILSRGQDCGMSRKIDLWTFMDSPRTKLVKYPLLFKSIEKHTPAGHEDHLLLELATEWLEEIIRDVDKQSGISKCQFLKSRLVYANETQKTPLIEESQLVVCDGTLKISSGKLHVYLFENVLVLTKPSTQKSTLKYQVYGQPIPIGELVVEEGTQKRGLGKSRPSFKVYSNVSPKTSYTLLSKDEDEKQRWITSLQKILPEGAIRQGSQRGGLATQESMEEDDVMGSTFPSRARRSSAPSLSSMASMTSLSSLQDTDEEY